MSNKYLVVDDYWNGTLALFEVEWVTRYDCEFPINPKFLMCGECLMVIHAWMQKNIDAEIPGPLYEQCVQSNWDHLIPAEVPRAYRGQGLELGGSQGGQVKTQD